MYFITDDKRSIVINEKIKYAQKDLRDNHVGVIEIHDKGSLLDIELRMFLLISILGVFASAIKYSPIRILLLSVCIFVAFANIATLIYLITHKNRYHLYKITYQTPERVKQNLDPIYIELEFTPERIEYLIHNNLLENKLKVYR